MSAIDSMTMSAPRSEQSWWWKANELPLSTIADLRNIPSDFHSPASWATARSARPRPKVRWHRS